MEAVMGETGGNKEEVNAPTGMKDEMHVNGDLNGSCEDELMEVCEVSPLKQAGDLSTGDVSLENNSPENESAVNDSAENELAENDSVRDNLVEDADPSDPISEENGLDKDSGVQNGVEEVPNSDVEVPRADVKEPEQVIDLVDNEGDDDKPDTNGDERGAASSEDPLGGSQEAKEEDVLEVKEKEGGEEEDIKDKKGPEDELAKANKPKKQRKSAPPIILTPRRSSRNLNRVQKTYSEKEEDPDIEEITPQDPLADPLASDLPRDDKENSKGRHARRSNSTIVVNDAKKLVEIATGGSKAAGPSSTKSNRKEPTLVIIDTNSILSGRGPVPLSTPAPSSSVAGYSVLPVALPAQGVYPPQRHHHHHQQQQHQQQQQLLLQQQHHHPPPPPPPPPPKPPQILPTLTDDMYVVEAPSFIVPYVYEKPPIKPLKDFVDRMAKEIRERLEREEKEAEEAEQKAKEEEEKRVQQETELAKEKAKEEAERLKEEALQKEQDSPEDTDEGKIKVDADNTDPDAKDESSEHIVKMDVDEEQPEGNSKDEDQEGETAEIKRNDMKEERSEDDDRKSEEDKEKIADKDKDTGINEKKKEEGKSKEEELAARKEVADVLDKKDEEKKETDKDKVTKPPTYFDNPLGKFFMSIGMSLVQEHVQTDLLRSQRRKWDRQGGQGGAVTQFAISSLLKNLELSKENNEPYHTPLKKCEHCSFKTESSLVMAQHLETPHMRNYVYRCNFCVVEVRSPHDILFHMEAEHNVRGRLERAPAFHQCPNCPFEDNQKGKLTRHLLSCAKKHRPEKNQEPPADWEPPAKIPRGSRKASSLGLGAVAYHQAALAAKQAGGGHHALLPKLVPAPSSVAALSRGRGRPPIYNRHEMPMQRPIVPSHMRQSMLYRPSSSATQPQMFLPTTYQIAGSQIYQVVGNQGQMMPVAPSNMPQVPRLTLMSQTTASSPSAPTPVALIPNVASGNNSITIQSANRSNPAARLLQQPSISITPLPRQTTGSVPAAMGSRPGAAQSGGGKATFVICEICDGYIKDLEQLRNHMQWIHKVKIHPKMIYNRPPLNCQKCQFRFFTDQGLERHLLGSHGLVTSSMQEAANKGKDGGRCPVCGRVYQWRLLNHVSRDHNMTLKPAHLSYKCTVCTATFGMYKQFENHVYSAHSVVAKRVMEKKSPPTPRPQGGDSLLRPLRINDEITIIPQPARPRPGPASRTGAISAMAQRSSRVHSCQRCEATFDGPAGFSQMMTHVRRRHLRRCGVKLCRMEACNTCSKRLTPAMIEKLSSRKEDGATDVIELSDDEVVVAGQGRHEITITKVSCAPGPKRFKQRLQRNHRIQVIELDEPRENGGEDSLSAVKERLRRRKSLEISQVDSECPSPQSGDETPPRKCRRNDD